MVYNEFTRLNNESLDHQGSKDHIDYNKFQGYNKLNEFVHKETQGRVRIAQVEFMEHGKNTAIYER